MFVLLVAESRNRSFFFVELCVCKNVRKLQPRDLDSQDLQVIKQPRIKIKRRMAAMTDT